MFLLLYSSIFRRFSFQDLPLPSEIIFLTSLDLGHLCPSLVIDCNWVAGEILERLGTLYFESKGNIFFYKIYIADKVLLGFGTSCSSPNLPPSIDLPERTLYEDCFVELLWVFCQYLAPDEGFPWDIYQGKCCKLKHVAVSGMGTIHLGEHAHIVSL